MQRNLILSTLSLVAIVIAFAGAGARTARAQDGGAQLDASTRSIQVWTKRYWNHLENPLTSELAVNGKMVNIFSSDSSATIGTMLVHGWNKISIKTGAQEPPTEGNELLFSFGPVTKNQDGRSTMKPLIWTFRNGTDWKRSEEGRYVHALGPNAKEVEVTYPVFYAGLDRDGLEVKSGDYVVQASPYWNHLSVPLTATVYVNDTPLTTFLGVQRQVVITSLIKPGKNVIKLVTARVTNSFEGNDIKIDVVGPAEWVPANSRFEFKPILHFDAMQGWTKHPKTGVLIAGNDPSKERFERTASFFIN